MLIFLLFTLVLQVAGQGTTTTVKGFILDEFRTPLVGVNVVLEGTYHGISTDVNGYFELRIDQPAPFTLAIRSIGFKIIKKVISTAGSVVDLGKVMMQPDALELEDVIVSVNGFVMNDKKIAMKKMDILTTAGANADIPASLNTLPGTQIVGEEGKIFVRGGDDSETRTFIDGLSVMSPYNASVPNIPARGRFSPQHFEGINFNTGGYSAEFGQALSSILQLQSIDIPEVQGGSIGLTSVGFNGSFSKKWKNDKRYFSLSTDYTDLSAYFKLIPQRVDWVSPFKTINSRGAYRAWLSDKTIVKVSGDHGRTAFRINQLDIDKLERMVNVSIKDDYGYLNSSIETVLKNDWELFVGLAKNIDHDLLTYDTISFEKNQYDAQFKLKFSKPLSNNLKIKVGSEYFYQMAREDILFSDRRFDNRSYTYGHQSLFLEADFALNSRWYAQMGERIAYNTYLNETTYMTRASLTHKLTNKSTLSGAFGQYYQLPEVTYLLYKDGDLKSNRATHYLVSFQKKLNKRILKIEYYYKSYQQLVKYRNNFRFGKPGFNNEGKGYATGFDLFYRDSKTLHHADFWISYSWLSTKRNYQNFPVMARPRFAATHTISVVYKKWLNKLSSQIGFTYSFNSGRPYNDPASTEFNGSKTPSFNNLSFNWSYITSLWKNYTIVHFSCSNILGFENTFGYRFSQSVNENGGRTRIPIRQNARRFIFLGVFISFRKSK